MQPSNHFKGETPLLAQDFRDTPAPTQHRFQIFARHAELIHPKVNGFDGIWGIDGMMLRFVGLNE